MDNCSTDVVYAPPLDKYSTEVVYNPPLDNYSTEVVHPFQVDKYSTEGVYNPPQWINIPGRNCTALPSGQMIHGGTAHASKVADVSKNSRRGVNNSRRGQIIHRGG